MLIDPSLNSVATVLANLHQSFLEAAVRCLEYARALSKVRTTCSNLLISTSKLSRCEDSNAQSIDARAGLSRGRVGVVMNDGLIARKRARHTPRAIVIAPATLAKEIADGGNCRDGRQHDCTSPCDATVPFTLARQQRGKDCAGRHLAAAAFMVRVAKLPCCTVSGCTICDLARSPPRFAR